MRQPRHTTPLFPLVALLLMCCAGGCIAAVPRPKHRHESGETTRWSGPLSMAVVPEVPRKGQGATQAYTAVNEDDSSDWAPIRIEVVTEDLRKTRNKKKKYCDQGKDTCYNALWHAISCEVAHVLTEAKRKLYIEKIIAGAVKLHSERLLVKPSDRNIIVPKNMEYPCNHFTVPTSHKQTGVPNADFVIYAAARPATDHRAVWATTCATFDDLRPSIGVMNFDPKYMTDTAGSVRAAAHEMAHALGFSKESLNEKNMMKVSESLVRGKRRKMVVGENVQTKAKAHFGCETLEGMELEDDDTTGERDIPHWKERHARDELMAPTVGAGYYTALTLAVFADMGYYRVNWDMAEPMSWGNHTGCDFLNKKCNQTKNLAGHYPHMFCDDSDKETLRCTSDRRYVGTCTEYVVEDRGNLKEKDVCPVVSSELYTSTGTTYNACSDPEVASLPGSLTGSDSWCLDAESLVVKDGSEHKNIRGVCAKVLCAAGRVKVKYLGSDTWHKCPDGGQIEVASDDFESGGMIKCPKYGEVCTIAANGSSLVTPSALEDDEADDGADEEDAPSPAAKWPPDARETFLGRAPGAAAVGFGVDPGQDFVLQLRAKNDDDAEEQGQGMGSVGTGDGANGAPNTNAGPPPPAGVSAPAAYIPSVTISNAQAKAGGVAWQFGHDGGMAAAGLGSFLLLAAATAAVAMVPF